MGKQEFEAKIGEVARLLGLTATFDYEWSINHAFLNKSNSFSLCVRSGDYQTKGRLRIYGVFPRTEKDESVIYGKWPEITVSAEKTAAQIARDIHDYQAMLEEALDRVKKSNDFAHSQKTNMAKIANYLGIEPQERIVYAYGTLKGLDGSVEAADETRVKFSLRVTVETALKVFDLLKAEG
jgi:hypothetical protein